MLYSLALSIYAIGCIVLNLCWGVAQAFALSEELNEWLLFDDTTIKQIGSWQDVANVMKAGRLQPSLLFYEQL